MSAHAFDLIATRQDELLDEEQQRMVRLHLSACAECRAFDRELDQAERLLRTPEPDMPLPALMRPRASSTSGTWLGVLSTAVVLLVVVTLVAGGAIRQRALRDGRAGTPDLRPIGATMVGTRIGASADDVRRALGKPQFLADASRMWTYPSGIVVFFDGPSGQPDRVERIFAPRGAVSGAPGFAVETAEGFSVLGDTAEFRRIYADYPIAASEAAALQTVLAVSGRGPDATDLSVVAVFEPTGWATSLTVFRGLVFGATLPDPCVIIAPAVEAAGMGSAQPRLGPGGVSPHGWAPWGALGCAAIWDSGWQDPHLLIRLEPTSRAAAPALLKRIFPAEIASWSPEGSGIWVGHAGDAWSAVAVSAEPYFFVVTYGYDGTAQRLAQAVLAELKSAR